jgi:hypothetical protein
VISPVTRQVWEETHDMVSNLEDEDLA